MAAGWRWEQSISEENRRTQEQRRYSMATPATGAHLTPERIFNALNAHEQTAALLTAIELDIFSAIGAAADTAAALPAKTGGAAKCPRVLCHVTSAPGPFA